MSFDKKASVDNGLARHYRGPMTKIFEDLLETARAARTELADRLRDLEQQQAELLQQIRDVKSKIDAIDRLDAPAPVGLKARIDKLDSMLGHGRPLSDTTQQVLDLIAKHGDTIQRSDLIVLLDAQKDKILQQRIDNSLVSLKQRGYIASENGRYYALKVFE